VALATERPRRQMRPTTQKIMMMKEIEMMEDQFHSTTSDRFKTMSMNCRMNSSFGMTVVWLV
jgi:hypothetical protein